MMDGGEHDRGDRESAAHTGALGATCPWMRHLPELVGRRTREHRWQPESPGGLPDLWSASAYDRGRHHRRCTVGDELMVAAIGSRVARLEAWRRQQRITRVA